MSSSSASVLVERFDAYLHRRSRSALDFGPGEAVTATVALLRGCRRAAGRFEGVQWWLRADGCPIAVEDEEGPDAVAATADAIAHVASMADDPTRDVLVRVRVSVLTLPPREWEELERRLFRHARPMPLVLGPLTPLEQPPIDDRSAAGPSALTLALVDAGLGEAVREAWRDLCARWRDSRALRLGTVSAAGALVVLAGALAWPHPGAPADPSPGAPSAEVVEAPRSTAPPVVRVPPSPTPEGPIDLEAAEGESPAVAPALPAETAGPSLDDPVEAARALFRDMDRCDGEAACIAAFAEDATAPREPLPHGAAGADVELIDDFGGVVVVRLTVDGATQYVTLVRRKDRWLVRAARTVADQPS